MASVPTKIYLILSVSVCLWVVASKTALACPNVSGFVDFNCDGKIQIGFAGDSFVVGEGDPQGGGYVGRLAGGLSGVRVVGLGRDGFTSRRYFQKLKRELNRRGQSRTLRRLLSADLIVLDLGRNDFFDEADPELTIRYLTRLARLIRREVKKRYDYRPFIALLEAPPTRRSSQNFFIRDLGREITKLPDGIFDTYLELGQFPTSLISGDGIHPRPQGYRYLTDVLEQSFRGFLQRSFKARRPDRDRDGVFDLFERRRFGTSPRRRDTDQDGVSDFREIFGKRRNGSTNNQGGTLCECLD